MTDPNQLMQVVIKEADEHNFWQVNQCDSSFTVDSKLCLHCEAGEIHYTIVTVPTYEKRYPTQEIDQATYLHQPDKAIYFAYKAGALAGQIILVRNWNGYAYIEDIRVGARYRRQGIARRLLTTAVEWARRKGLPGLMLETQNNNVAACRLYEQFGFRLQGFDQYLYKGLEPGTEEIALYWYMIL